MFTSSSNDALLYILTAALLLVLVLLAGLIISLYIIQKIKKQRLLDKEKFLLIESELDVALQNTDEFGQRNAYLEREIRRLSPYAAMPNIIAETRHRRAAAEEYFLKRTQDADARIHQAKADADSLIAESRKRISEKNEVADAVLHQARERADAILNDADLRAEQIAGNAWEMKDRVGFYQRTAQAMQNKVKGYGDEYLIPHETLIDGLGEAYDHEEAGRQLNRVRARIKMMIRDGTAAECDHEDALRKERSIAFVLDAFNGRAESILANAKADNYGQMEAKLVDAFELVNFNGKSFKNARITDKYADLYRAQLKYLIQIMELKRRDKEQQRRIKAGMRKEKQAQKDYKRAQKQIDKEPKRILKAIKKVESKLKKAPDSQKREYQVQLADLMGKLSEAESRCDQTLSMALDAKQGYVYVVSNIGSFGENVLKIGSTRRLEPQDEVNALGDESVPFDFDVHAIIHSQNALELEQYLHSKFESKRINKVNAKKTFYNLTLGEIRAEIESLDLECQWTMKADAIEFRESDQMRMVFNRKDADKAEILEIG